jgi:hypothetical protein
MSARLRTSDLSSTASRRRDTRSQDGVQRVKEILREPERYRLAVSRCGLRPIIGVPDRSTRTRSLGLYSAKIWVKHRPNYGSLTGPVGANVRTRSRDFLSEDAAYLDAPNY